MRARPMRLLILRLAHRHNFRLTRGYNPQAEAALALGDADGVASLNDNVGYSAKCNTDPGGSPGPMLYWNSIAAQGFGDTQTHTGTRARAHTHTHNLLRCIHST